MIVPNENHNLKAILHILDVLYQYREVILVHVLAEPSDGNAEYVVLFRFKDKVFQSKIQCDMFRLPIKLDKDRLWNAYNAQSGQKLFDFDFTRSKQKMEGFVEKAFHKIIPFLEFYNGRYDDYDAIATTVDSAFGKMQGNSYGI